MADLTFNTKAGAVVERKLLILFLNTGTGDAPVWSAIGKRVEDSSMEYDWQEESKQDVLGDTHSTMRKPIIKQTFDPCELDAGDAAQLKIWNLAVKDQDAAALCNQDLLVVHTYAGDAETGVFAERYPASMVKPSGLGGSANVAMPIDVTFGGKRAIGTATVGDAGVTFVPEGAAAAAAGEEA